MEMQDLFQAFGRNWVYDDMGREAGFNSSILNHAWKLLRMAHKWNLFQKWASLEQKEGKQG